MNKKETFFTIIDYKEQLLSIFVVFLCLFLLFIFPTQNYPQKITALIFFLFITPLLYIKTISQKKLSDFGLNIYNKKTGFLWAGSMIFFFITLFYFLYNYTGFKVGYMLPNLVTQNFWAFLIYELIFINAFFFFLHFFFCGFIFFSFIEKFSYWTILFQVFFFFIFFLLSTGFSWQSLPALVISLTSGIIVYKSRSIFYAQIFTVLSFIILDSFIIYHLK